MAVAASVVVSSCSTVVSAVRFKLDLGLALTMGAALALGAVGGTRLALYVSKEALKLTIGVLLVLLGLYSVFRVGLQ